MVTGEQFTTDVEGAAYYALEDPDDDRPTWAEVAKDGLTAVRQRPAEVLPACVLEAMDRECMPRRRP